MSFIENAFAIQAAPVAAAAVRPTHKGSRGTLYDSARDALDRRTDPMEWRGELGDRIRRVLDGGRAALQSPDLRFAVSALARALDGTLPVNRELPARPDPAVYVVHRAKGEELGTDILCIAESAEFEELNGCVVVCLGDVRARRIDHSVVFATGRVEAKEHVRRSIVMAEGGVEADSVERCLLKRPGGLEAREQRDNAFLDAAPR